VVVKRYRVAGRVQGVGYRAFVLRQTTQLGLSGWVRNLSDGTVEALVDASEVHHAAFENLLKEGPRHAEVRLVLVVEEPDQTVLPEGFTIAHERG
jgi:acylphosphatase